MPETVYANGTLEPTAVRCIVTSHKDKICAKDTLGWAFMHCGTLLSLEDALVRWDTTP